MSTASWALVCELAHTKPAGGNCGDNAYQTEGLSSFQLRAHPRRRHCFRLTYLYTRWSQLSTKDFNIGSSTLNHWLARLPFACLTPFQKHHYRMLFTCCGYLAHWKAHSLCPFSFRKQWPDLNWNCQSILSTTLSAQTTKSVVFIDTLKLSLGLLMFPRCQKLPGIYSTFIWGAT
jgi:hypothetical protein